MTACYVARLYFLDARQYLQLTLWHSELAESLKANWRSQVRVHQEVFWYFFRLQFLLRIYYMNLGSCVRIKHICYFLIKLHRVYMRIFFYEK